MWMFVLNTVVSNQNMIENKDFVGHWAEVCNAQSFQND